jgi:hypothetical protein
MFRRNPQLYANQEHQYAMVAWGVIIPSRHGRITP